MSNKEDILKLNIVLRTCDKTSIESNRIVDKPECVIRCFNALTNSLKNINHSLYVIDDNSSEETINLLKEINPNATFFYHTPIEENNNKVQRSRQTVKVAYDLINTLQDNELVYLVEDDYLHYSNSIKLLLEAHEYFTNFIKTDIVIFPQDFNQMYDHPNNPVGRFYSSIPSHIFKGPDRYYRTTWFTHESFLLPVKTVKKYFNEFLKVLTHGTDGNWEGTTLSNIWSKPDVTTLMPLGTLAIHLGAERDISFFTDWQELWDSSEYTQPYEDPLDTLNLNDIKLVA